MPAFNITANLNLKSNLANIRGYGRQIGQALKAGIGNLSFKIDIDFAKGKLTPQNVTALSKSFNDLKNTLYSLSPSISKASEEFRKLAIAIAGIGKATRPFQRVANSINKTSQSMKDAGINARNMGLSFSNTFDKFASYVFTATALYSVFNILSRGIQEFLKFDQGLVKVAQVSNATIGQIKSLSDEIGRLSMNFGVSSNELVTAAETLSQAGLSVEDVKITLEGLAKASLAPNFKDMNDTTEALIATFAQFGKSAKDTQSILSSINAVAGATAVEASDITAAIKRAGGAFAATGGDLNDLIGLFTSVRATTRESAESIATGFRTIFTRLQRKETVDALEEIGVKLTDLEGKFVGPYEAIRRLSEGLKLIDTRDIRFSQIIEELGGYRQISKVIPLLKEFATAEKSRAIAIAGANSLTIDAAKAQEGLLVKITKVTESFFNFIRIIGNSETFRGLIKVITDLSSALVTLGKTLSSVLPVISSLFIARGIGGAVSFAGGFLSGKGGQNLIDIMSAGLSQSKIGSRFRDMVGLPQPKPMTPSRRLAQERLQRIRNARSESLQSFSGGAGLGLGILAIGGASAIGSEKYSNAIGTSAALGLVAGGVTSSLAQVAIGFKLISNPIGITIVAIAGLTAAIYGFYNSIKESNEAIAKEQQAIKFRSKTRDLGKSIESELKLTNNVAPGTIKQIIDLSLSRTSQIRATGLKEGDTAEKIELDIEREIIPLKETSAKIAQFLLSKATIGEKIDEDSFIKLRTFIAGSKDKQGLEDTLKIAFRELELATKTGQTKVNLESLKDFRPEQSRVSQITILNELNKYLDFSSKKLKSFSSELQSATNIMNNSAEGFLDESVLSGLEFSNAKNGINEFNQAIDNVTNLLGGNASILKIGEQSKTINKINAAIGDSITDAIERTPNDAFDLIQDFTKNLRQRANIGKTDAFGNTLIELVRSQLGEKFLEGGTDEGNFAKLIREKSTELISALTMDNAELQFLSKSIDVLISGGISNLNTKFNDLAKATDNLNQLFDRQADLSLNEELNTAGIRARNLGGNQIDYVALNKFNNLFNIKQSSLGIGGLNPSQLGDRLADLRRRQRDASPITGEFQKLQIEINNTIKGLENFTNVADRLRGIQEKQARLDQARTERRSLLIDFLTGDAGQKQNMLSNIANARTAAFTKSLPLNSPELTRSIIDFFERNSANELFGTGRTGTEILQSILNNIAPGFIGNKRIEKQQFELDEASQRIYAEALEANKKLIGLQNDLIGILQNSVNQTIQDNTDAIKRNTEQLNKGLIQQLEENVKRKQKEISDIKNLKDAGVTEQTAKNVLGRKGEAQSLLNDIEKYFRDLFLLMDPLLRAKPGKLFSELSPEGKAAFTTSQKDISEIVKVISESLGKRLEDIKQRGKGLGISGDAGQIEKQLKVIFETKTAIQSFDETIKRLQTAITDLNSSINLLKKAAQPQVQLRSLGGIIHAKSVGTDTIPAMLTPGEFVINRKQSSKYKKILEAINNDTLNNNVLLLQSGGIVDNNRVRRIIKAREDLEEKRKIRQEVENDKLEKQIGGINPVNIGDKLTTERERKRQRALEHAVAMRKSQDQNGPRIRGKLDKQQSREDLLSIQQLKIARKNIKPGEVPDITEIIGKAQQERISKLQELQFNPKENKQKIDELKRKEPNLFKLSEEAKKFGFGMVRGAAAPKVAAQAPVVTAAPGIAKVTPEKANVAPTGNITDIMKQFDARLKQAGEIFQKGMKIQIEGAANFNIQVNGLGDLKDGGSDKLKTSIRNYIYKEIAGTLRKTDKNANNFVDVLANAFEASSK